ncbi:MAG: hypothetical protein JXB43_00660, partial [Dehalococcoidia bacterium]|nr:hypothetical protein [Dehalococcoidia bacterium]
NVYTVVSQPFSASGGSRISGWAFFKAEDYTPYNDEGRVEITVKSGGQVLSTLFQSSVSAVGDYGGTPWTYWSYVFTRSDQYTIEAKITNIWDSSYPSALGLDGVSIHVTPPQRPQPPPQPAATAPPLILAKELDINPQEAYIGQPITISASMSNEGDNSAEYTADLKINGQTEQMKTGNVDGHSSVPVNFTVTRSQPGTYTVDLSGQKGTFTVLAPQTNSNSPASSSPTIAIILISALVLCIAGILIVALRRTA